MVEGSASVTASGGRDAAYDKAAGGGDWAEENALERALGGGDDGGEQGEDGRDAAVVEETPRRRDMVDERA